MSPGHEKPWAHGSTNPTCVPKSVGALLPMGQIITPVLSPPMEHPRMPHPHDISVADTTQLFVGQAVSDGNLQRATWKYHCKRSPKPLTVTGCCSRRGALAALKKPCQCQIPMYAVCVQEQAGGRGEASDPTGHLGKELGKAQWPALIKLSDHESRKMKYRGAPLAGGARSLTD